MKKYFGNVCLYTVLIYTVLSVVMATVGAGALLVEWMFLDDNGNTARVIIGFILLISLGSGFLAAWLSPWPEEPEEEDEDELGDGDWVDIKTYSKIVRNAVKCNNCGDEIESTHVHNFVACSCFKNKEHNKGIAVDGGLDYLRRVGNLDDYTDLSESDEYRISQFKSKIKPKRSES